MRELFVANTGKFVKLDDQDVNIFMMGIPWHDDNGYLLGKINKRRTLLHVAIGKAMGLTGICDHYDRDKYNVRRSNLKSVCHILSARNRGVLQTTQAELLVLVGTNEAISGWHA